MVSNKELHVTVSLYALAYATKKSQIKQGGVGIEWNTPVSDVG
jgi:hypothetical protein